MGIGGWTHTHTPCVIHNRLFPQNKSEAIPKNNRNSCQPLCSGMWGLNSQNNPKIGSQCYCQVVIVCAQMTACMDET